MFKICEILSVNTRKNFSNRKSQDSKNQAWVRQDIIWNTTELAFVRVCFSAAVAEHWSEATGEHTAGFISAYRSQPFIRPKQGRNSHRNPNLEAELAKRPWRESACCLDFHDFFRLPSYKANTSWQVMTTKGCPHQSKHKSTLREGLDHRVQELLCWFQFCFVFLVQNLLTVLPGTSQASAAMINAGMVHLKPVVELTCQCGVGFYNIQKSKSSWAIESQTKLPQFLRKPSTT